MSYYCGKDRGGRAARRKPAARPLLSRGASARPGPPRSRLDFLPGTHSLLCSVFVCLVLVCEAELAPTLRQDLYACLADHRSGITTVATPGVRASLLTSLWILTVVEGAKTDTHCKQG